jgi:membrane-associated protein
MLSAGLVGLSWRRFAAYDLAAGVLWASYAGAIGWLGGKAFVEQPAYALLLAFGVAAALALALEAGRRLVRR